MSLLTDLFSRAIKGEPVSRWAEATAQFCRNSLPAGFVACKTLCKLKKGYLAFLCTHGQMSSNPALF